MKGNQTQQQQLDCQQLTNTKTNTNESKPGEYEAHATISKLIHSDVSIKTVKEPQQQQLDCQTSKTKKASLYTHVYMYMYVNEYTCIKT